MKNKKRNYLILVLVVLLLALAVGYAAFSDTLNITGTANAKGTFDMIFESATVDDSKGITDSTGNTFTPTASITDDTLTVTVGTLGYPGAGANFTAVIKNNGTVPAKLNDINFTGINDTIIKVTFPQFTKGEIVQPGGTCTVKFSVQWDPTLTDAVETQHDLTFTATLDYTQDTTQQLTPVNSHTDA